MTRLQRLHESVVEQPFDTISELRSVAQKVKNFMKNFEIGYKIKSFKEEPGAIQKTRSILQGWMDADYTPEGGSAALARKMKDELVTYKGGEPNILDYEIERVARTELSAMRELSKIIAWKKQGYTQVKHLTHITKNTGEKDKRFNGRIFEIDYLLGHPEDRVPLHPSCRCQLTLYK